MQDRISTYPGRVKLIPVSGRENIYDMTRQDNPTTEGTPLNKANLLSDETCEAIGIQPDTGTPNEALAALNTKVKGVAPKTATISLPTASWTGSDPYTQTVTITGTTVNSKVDIQMDATALGVLIDSGTSAIWIENNNGTLTAKALGEKPNADLSVQVTITEVTA